MRRLLLNEEVLDEMGLKYTKGEFVGDGLGKVTIEHGLGEVPLLFAFLGNEIGEETTGTFSGMLLNLDVATRYTTALSKNWADLGTCMVNDGTNVLMNVNPNSMAYGVIDIDENSVVVNVYGSKQYFISGKTYKWIAIADWR